VTQQAFIASPKPTGETADQDYLWCNCTEVSGVTAEKKSQGFQRHQTPFGELPSFSFLYC